MAKKLALLCLLLLFTTSSNAHGWSKEPEKYINVFYPNGTPTKEYKDGVARWASYEFLAETPYDNDNLLIVYVLKYPALMEDYVPETDLEILENEECYVPFLAIIDKEDNKVLFRKDISDFAGGTPYVDAYAATHVFSIKKDLNAIHVEFALQESGTGHGTYTDDQFFILDNNNLTGIFKIEKSEFLWRCGWECYDTDVSALYVADVDNDGTNEILLQNIHNRQRGEKNDTTADEAFTVYKFDDATDAYGLSGTVQNVPDKHSILRDRTPQPN